MNKNKKESNDNMQYESSYFSDYIKSFNAQNLTGGTFMLSPQILNSNLKDINMLSSHLSTDQISRMVMQPHNYEQELRKLSLYNFNTIGLYKQLINLWSKMLTFDWNPIPYSLDGKTLTSSDFSSAAFKKDYSILTKFFNSFKAREEFSKVLWNICMYDTYFTSYREFEDHIYLQELPSSHSIIDADSYLGYLFSFDFSYFTNSGIDINAYSPTMKSLYNKALSNKKMSYRPDMPNRNGNWVYWHPMSPDDAYVFKFNKQFAGSIPPILSSMIDYSKIDKYKELEDTKKELEAYKVIFATVPRLSNNKTGNKTDDFAVSATELGKFVSAVKDTLQKVDFKAAPLEDFKVFDFAPSANEKNLLETELKNIMLGSGTTTALSLVDGVNMASAAIYKIFTSSVIEDLYSQFSNFCEYHVNKDCKKYRWKIEFVGNMFDRDERIKRSNEDMERGIITPNIFSSRGIQITDASNVQTMMYSLGFPDSFRPIQRSSTLSSADVANTNGKPQKDESELSDSGAQTRNASSNGNTKGTVGDT